MARSSSQELARAVEEARGRVAVGGRYAHYKHPGRYYEVVALAILEATEEVAVVYRALYGDGLVFVRPLSNWLEVIETEEGTSVPRFAAV